MNSAVRPHVETIWNYLKLNHPLEKADAIIVLGSHDDVVAERGAELFLEGWAPLLVFSGGLGVITRHLWNEPEAERFARIAIAIGVPRDRILLETRSTNTGENVRFTRSLLEQRGFRGRNVIVVQKPYMERRAFATFRKEWPGVDVIVASPNLPLDDYLARCATEQIPVDAVIGIIAGDLQRIRVYPERGLQIAQEIPEEVWTAFETLVAAGYDGHLVAG